VTNLTSFPIEVLSTGGRCTYEPILELRGTIENYFPKQDPTTGSLNDELCWSSGSLLLEGETLSRDITWKQQVPVGEYVLVAHFLDVEVTLPIKIEQYGILEPSIQNIKALDLSPKKQSDLGIPSELVVCDEKLKLIFKASDGSPACVKPSSMEKLVGIGWTNNFSRPQNTVWLNFVYQQCGGPIWARDWSTTHEEPWKYPSYGEIEQGEIEIIKNT